MNRLLKAAAISVMVLIGAQQVHAGTANPATGAGAAKGFPCYFDTTLALGATGTTKDSLTFGFQANRVEARIVPTTAAAGDTGKVCIMIRGGTRTLGSGLRSNQRAVGGGANATAGHGTFLYWSGTGIQLGGQILGVANWSSGSTPVFTGLRWANNGSTVSGRFVTIRAWVER